MTKINPVRRIPYELDKIIMDEKNKLDISYVDTAKLLTRKLKKTSKSDEEIFDEIFG
jgi:hypothetical protein